MKIVTGRTGSPHVTSEQHRQILEGTIGQGSFILTSGDNLEPELVSNNQLKIRSGILCHHGCVSAVELGTYDTVQLDNGSQGKKRIDVIVCRYNKNNSTDIEASDWVVIKGTETTETPTAPNVMMGNMQDGDLIDDCAVFEIHYDGINVTEVKKLLDVTKNMSEMEAGLAELNGKLTELKITSVKYPITLEKNQYVIGGYWKSYWQIPESDIEKYGTPVYVALKNGDSSAGLATFADTEGNGKTACSFSGNNTSGTAIVKFLSL